MKLVPGEDDGLALRPQEPQSPETALHRAPLDLALDSLADERAGVLTLGAGGLDTDERPVREAGQNLLGPLKFSAHIEYPLLTTRRS